MYLHKYSWPECSTFYNILVYKVLFVWLGFIQSYLILYESSLCLKIDLDLPEEADMSWSDWTHLRLFSFTF